MREAIASWWVLVPLVPFGWLSWVSFLYAGLRARKRPWLAWALAYFVTGVGGLVLVGIDEGGDGVDGPLETLGVILSFATMFASFVHALVIRRPFLRRMAILTGELEVHETRREAEAIAREIARTQPHRAQSLGIGRPDVEGAFDGGLIDVNSAPAETLAQLPGVDAELAIRIAAARRDVHRFSSLEDMGAVLDLPAPVVEEMRSRAVFL